MHQNRLTLSLKLQMKIEEIISCLEAIASPIYQESYDNAGLLTGDGSSVCTGVLIALDATDSVVHEAIEKI
jgi:putative NIF3 family GTP cyclohydrolase 1 type 2